MLVSLAALAGRPGSAAEISPGLRVVAATDTTVRGSPSAAALVLGTNHAGMLGTVVDGPVVESSTTWWYVDYEGVVDGWSAASDLALPYFPGSEASGGWHSLVVLNAVPTAAQKANIRDIAGLDWDKLKLAQDYSRSFSSSSSTLVIRNGWVAGEWGVRSASGVASVSKSLTGLTLAKLLDLSAAGALPRTIGPDDFVYPYLPAGWGGADARGDRSGSKT